MNYEREDIVRYKLGKTPKNIAMVGVLFLAVGVTLILQLWYLKIVFTFIGVAILSIRDYLEVDYSNKRLMLYMTIFGYRVGQWQNIASAKYLTLVKVWKRERVSFLSISNQQKKLMIKASLVFGSRRYITLFKLNRKQAFSITKEIAAGLAIPIHDYTRKNKEKLTPRIIEGSFD
ncbi:MAG: hypothetical protein PF489_06675 [Salinivirgaceae bacterium]|jgi:hypothetical protein|nr:hypothetical protein [Salinivirgaceae bacterium]